MPADRLFHPRLGHSRKVSALSHLENRVWVQYVLSADDFGVMLFAAAPIQAGNSALDHESRVVIETALARLAEVGLITIFDHQGQRWACQLDWQDWQKIRYPRESYQPSPPTEILQKCSRNTAGLFRKFHTTFQKSSKKSREYSRSRARDRETANGKRLTANGSTGEESEKGERLRRAPSRGLQRGGDLQANFERFWAAYPNKVGKDAARRVWRQLAPDNDLTDRMVAAVEQHCASAQWRKDGGQFIPHPRTWLKQGRWKDEGVMLSTTDAPVDLKRLLWRALGRDGRVWLEFASVTRTGVTVQLKTTTPDKLAPYHDTLLTAVREELGGDVELAIVAAEAGGA